MHLRLCRTASPSHTCTQRPALNSSFSRLFALSALQVIWSQTVTYYTGSQPEGCGVRGVRWAENHFSSFQTKTGSLIFFRSLLEGLYVWNITIYLWLTIRIAPEAIQYRVWDVFSGAHVWRQQLFVPEDSVLCDKSCWFSSLMCQHSNLQYFNGNAVDKMNTHLNVDWDMWGRCLHYILVKAALV